MYCKNCGRAHCDDEVFCKTCGTKIKDVNINNYQEQRKKEENPVFGVLSFVFGILSLFSIFGILSILFGIIGISTYKNPNDPKHTQNILFCWVGIVLFILTFVLAIILIISIL